LEKKTRVLIFADAHLFTRADRIQKEKEKNLPIGERLFLKISDLWFNSEIEKDRMHWRFFQKMAKKIEELEKTKNSFDWLVDLGDATFGSYNQGLISLEARKERLAYNELIDKTFQGERKKKKFIWGNHDVGFQDSISRLFNLGSWNKGISKKSFKAAEELIGPAWDFFKINDFNFLVLNSEVIRAVKTIESIDSSERSFFIKKEREQKSFIKEAFKEQGLFILMIHDPRQLKNLWPVLEQHSHRICLTLAGHLHATVSGERGRRICCPRASGTFFRTKPLLVVNSKSEEHDLEIFLFQVFTKSFLLLFVRTSQN